MNELKKPTLKDIRISWIRGILKRNGRLILEKSVKASLQTKWKQWGGVVPLTEEEIHEIIYKDTSKTTIRPNEFDLAQIRIKKYEAEQERLQIQRLKLEEKVLNKKAAIQARDDLLIQSKEYKKLLDKSEPSEFSLDNYRRTSIELCILAIQSMYPWLTKSQAKMVIGSWVRRGF